MNSAQDKPMQADRLSSIDWAAMIPDQDWPLYREVLTRALSAGVRFALGGGFAFSAYALRPRYTKDVDMYIRPEDRERMISILDEAGFRDYHDQAPYDRRWIYRGARETAIADVIWAMANQRSQVDASWLDRSRRIELHGLSLLVLPAEELIWTKLYVLQRDRSDWPDLLNVLHAHGPQLDWGHLLSRLDGDTRLLGGVLNVFCWMCPGRAAEFPKWIWDRVQVAPPAAGPDCDENRARVALLDSRDWFGRSNGHASH